MTGDRNGMTGTVPHDQLRALGFWSGLDRRFVSLAKPNQPLCLHRLKIDLGLCQGFNSGIAVKSKETVGAMKRC